MNSTPYCLEFLRVSKGIFPLRRLLQGCSSVLPPQQRDDPASASGLWLPQGMNLQGVGQRSPPLGLQQGPFESSCCLASGASAPWKQGYLIHTALWHMEERAYRIDELDSWSIRSKSSLGHCLRHRSTLPLRVSLSKQACTQTSQRIRTGAFFLIFHRVGPRYGSQVCTLSSRHFYSLAMGRNIYMYNQSPSPDSPIPRYKTMKEKTVLFTAY